MPAYKSYAAEDPTPVYSNNEVIRNTLSSEKSDQQLMLNAHQIKREACLPKQIKPQIVRREASGVTIMKQKKGNEQNDIQIQTEKIGKETPLAKHISNEKISLGEISEDKIETDIKSNDYLNFVSNRENRLHSQGESITNENEEIRIRQEQVQSTKESALARNIEKTQVRIVSRKQSWELATDGGS